MADANHSLPDGLTSAVLVISVMLLCLLFLVTLMLRTKRTDSNPQQLCDAPAGFAEEVLIEQTSLYINDDAADTEDAMEHHVDVSPGQDAMEHHVDVAPGLALLEQYCVFGVPSGSWSGRVQTPQQFD